MNFRCAALIAALFATAAPAQDSGQARRYALLVGVKNYKGTGLANLKYTENDVGALAGVLKGAGYKRVVVMTRSAANEQDDDDLRPTAANVRAQLQALLDGRGPGDDVLVAFAGHGVTLRPNKEFYFCPQGAQLDDPKSLVSLREVMATLSESRAGVRVLVVDACRNDPLAGRASGDEAVASVTRPALPKPPGGVAAFYSCSEGEKAFESDTHKRGVFFHHFVEGLQGKAANRKGLVTLDSLADYVKAEVDDTVKAEQGPRTRQKPEVFNETRGAVTLGRPTVSPAQLRRLALALNGTKDDQIEGRARELADDATHVAGVLNAARELVAGAKSGESPLDYNAAYGIAHVAMLRKDAATARPLLESCVEQARGSKNSPKLAQAYRKLIGLFLAHNKHEDCARACGRAIHDGFKNFDGFQDDLLTLLVVSLARAGHEAETLKLVDQFAAKLPSPVRAATASRLRGRIHLALERHAQAEAAFLEGIAEIKKDDKVPDSDRQQYIADVRYALANIYNTTGENAKAVEQLQKLIRLRPEEATYYNDLAYVWADQDVNLDEAERLARKAVELDSKAGRLNPPHLDTLGWVLFKRHRYAEAKEQLLKAAADQNLGQHIEILDHLADAHAALGEASDAARVWEKALRHEDANKRDADRRKRVEEKLKAVRAGG